MYEHEFSARPGKGRNEEKKAYEDVIHEARWEDFKPTYRGKPVPDSKAKPLATDRIHEISFMCRSNFGTQSGDFDLRIGDITAVAGIKPESRFARIWQWLFKWFMTILTFRRDNKGHIRL